MKKAFAFLFISILFFSCKKDKQVTIVGNWKEISVYTQDNSGVFYWSGPPNFPLQLKLTEDGKYFASYDVSAGYGTYQFNYSTKQLNLENISGNVDVRVVSVLDEDYLILDYYSNGIVQHRQKFLRNRN